MARYLLVSFAESSHADDITALLGEQLLITAEVDDLSSIVTTRVNGQLGDTPLHPHHPDVRRFWVFEATTRTEAEATAVRAAAAGEVDLELRPLRG